MKFMKPIFFLVFLMFNNVYAAEFNCEDQENQMSIVVKKEMRVSEFPRYSGSSWISEYQYTISISNLSTKTPFFESSALGLREEINQFDAFYTVISDKRFNDSRLYFSFDYSELDNEGFIKFAYLHEGEKRRHIKCKWND